MIVQYETELFGMEVFVEAAFSGNWIPATMTEQAAYPQIDSLTVQAKDGAELELDGVCFIYNNKPTLVLDDIEEDAYSRLCEQEGR